MAPNNFSASEATTTGNQSGICRNDVSVLSRKNKNILNTFEGLKTVDINGNITKHADTENLPGKEYKIEYAWFNIIGFVFLHSALIYGVYNMRVDATGVFTFIIGVCTGFGITAGTHRLWAHNSYKANTRLKIILLVFQTIAFQNSVYEWTRDHRVHHKYTDTNADPHNANRGFFFSHMGWLMCKKHPDVKKFGAKVSMKDLEADPLIMFQHKYYLILMPIFCFILPSVIPWYFWNESILKAFFITTGRYVIVLHITWLINSAAHFYGNRPYDKNIKPTDTYTVSMLAFGEGWHNFHHVFPWDYKTSELGRYWCNYSTCFLDICAWLGWATDLKTVSPEIINKRALRTGDGSRKSTEHISLEEIINSPVNDGRDTEHFWGWDDEEMTEHDKKDVNILYETKIP